MDAAQIGKWLVIAGVVIAIVGAAVWGLARLNLPLGRLPGDLTFGDGSFRVSIPLATSIVLSIALTVILNVIIRFWRR